MSYVGQGRIVARGHNRRVQNGDPTAHGEMECLRNAGRRTDWHKLILVSTLRYLCIIVHRMFSHLLIRQKKFYSVKKKLLYSVEPLMYIVNANRAPAPEDDKYS